MKAIDLYNYLSDYTIEELQDLDVVIEIGRDNRNTFGKSEYVNEIESYPSQIRLISKNN